MAAIKRPADRGESQQMKIARVAGVTTVFVYVAFEFSKYLHMLGMAG